MKVSMIKKIKAMQKKKIIQRYIDRKKKKGKRKKERLMKVILFESVSGRFEPTTPAQPRKYGMVPLDQSFQAEEKIRKEKRKM